MEDNMKNNIEESKSFRLSFGVLQSSIYIQLKKQKLSFEVDKVKYYQKLRESITYLKFAGMISDLDVRKLEQKLINKIRKHLEIKNK